MTATVSAPEIPDPFNPAGKEEGSYAVIRVGDPVRREWTNVGIVLFDNRGRKIGSRFDTMDRAIHRGDWVKGQESLTPEEWALQYTTSAATLHYLKMGDYHALSRIQTWEHLFCRLEEGTLNLLFNRLIKGEEEGEFYPCKPSIFEATYEKVEVS